MSPKLLTCGLLALAGADTARAGWPWPDHQVVVSSTATDAYTGQKFGASAAKPESYLFFQGKFYGGWIRDHGLERMQFNTIVQVLGKDLVKQNYFPSSDPKDADLLIVVHWGATHIVESVFSDSLDRPSAPRLQSDSPSSIHSADNQMRGLERGEQRSNILGNARLLGYGQQLSREQARKGDQTDIGTMNALFGNLDRERYFVILMAYDYRTMKKGMRPRLLWSTRFSIRGPGNSFPSALPLMSEAAADYFGHSDGLKAVKPHTLPVGTVKLGPLDVIGEVRKGEKTGAAAAPSERK